jgi:hypothetical protein
MRPKQLTSPVRAYFTYPENGSTQNAILLMTDVLGFEFPNVQLLVFLLDLASPDSSLLCPLFLSPRIPIY